MGWKRTVIGSVLKDKDDPKKSYIKINTDVSFKKGDCLNLESAAEQLASLDEAVASGKLNEEVAGRIRERVEKIPEFVRFEMVKLERVD